VCAAQCNLSKLDGGAEKSSRAAFRAVECARSVFAATCSRHAAHDSDPSLPQVGIDK